MGRDNSWLAMVPSVVVFSFSFSKAVHTKINTNIHTETGSASQVSRQVTVSTDLFTRPTAHFSLNGQSANPETPKIVEPYFQLQI